MANIENKKSASYDGLGFLVLAVLCAGFYWFFQQYMNAYWDMQASVQTTQRILDDQFTMNRKNRLKISVLEENLKQTEYLLAKMEQENDQLQQKVVLLNHMAEIESSLSQLKEKNAQISMEMATMKLKAEMNAGNFSTVGEGKKVLANFKNKLRQIKNRITGLKRDAVEKQILALREDDRVQSLLGNNGFLVKNGKTSAMEYPAVAKEKSVKIDVTIVK